MKGIILCVGQGKKIWPYNKYHNKGLLKIGNRPIVCHLVDGLKQQSIEEIIVAVDHQANEVARLFRHDSQICVMPIESSRGSADTLRMVMEQAISEEYLVIFGDCMIMEEDLRELIEGKYDILISHLHQPSTMQICAEVDKMGQLKQFWGHPRGSFSCFASAFHLKRSIIPYLETTSNFNVTKVGVGSPDEMYLESAINDYLEDNHVLRCYLSKNQIYDIDKPWHIMEANRYWNECALKTMEHQEIGEDTFINPNVKLPGKIRIGSHCYIGDQVVLNEGCVIEDRTRIDQGAIIGKGVHIGKNCIIENYCKIGDFTSIGDECIVGHTAEIIEGVLFDKVYLYHYGEYYGVIGTHTDIGAGTTCGTLRFDDGKTQHVVCGHREIPDNYSNACFIGDYSRTGVGAVLLPGCKVGSKSVVGSGVILNEDVEDNTLIYPKQTLVKKKWGDDQYGW